MGWSEGKGLGAKGTGIVNPIKAESARVDKNSKTLGLGADKETVDGENSADPAANGSGGADNMMIENFRALNKMKYNQKLDARRAGWKLAANRRR